MSSPTSDSAPEIAPIPAKEPSPTRSGPDEMENQKPAAADESNSDSPATDTSASPPVEPVESIALVANESGNDSTRSSPEPGLIDEATEEAGGAPLPSEPIPYQQQPDDGWEYHWIPADQSYWFYNRFTGAWQKENPRLPTTDGTASSASAAVTTAATAVTAVDPVVVAPPPEDTDPSAISDLTSVAGGYNPAIHGSYDPNAWYAKNTRAAIAQESTAVQGLVGGDPYGTEGYFNRLTGQWQQPDQGAERHSDEAKSKRQMGAYFDVDAAANQHDGRSLKAERSGKKPTRSELKAFKEKRKAKKEEKRRAWLRD